MAYAQQTAHTSEAITNGVRVHVTARYQPVGSETWVDALTDGTLSFGADTGCMNLWASQLEDGAPVSSP